MRVSKFIHACLLVEEGNDRILFDPGKFTFIEKLVKPDDFHSLSAIVLTHRHPDHIDDEALRNIVGNNPDAQILANSQVGTQLKEQSIYATVFENGTRQVGTLHLEAMEATHAPLLNSETPRNIAYVVNEHLLHPGDSFDRSLDPYRGIDLLALPVMAPWNTELEVAEFALRISPKRVIPIHDGYAKDFFLKQRYQNFENYFNTGLTFMRWANREQAWKSDEGLIIVARNVRLRLQFQFLSRAFRTTACASPKLIWRGRARQMKLNAPFDLESFSFLKNAGRTAEHQVSIKLIVYFDCVNNAAFTLCAIDSEKRQVSAGGDRKPELPQVHSS
jgi:L-ascorbate metabolism protein UlaG (beta-lactamase superfamily)